jgi:hypothetical protein
MMIVPPTKQQRLRGLRLKNSIKRFSSGILILSEDETRLYSMGCAYGQIPCAKVKRFTRLCSASLPELVAM